MILACTGHRPNKLATLHYDWSVLYKDFKPQTMKIYYAMEQIVNELRPWYMISGMALGADIIWANLALNRGIPLLAYVPFEGQESRWPKKTQAEWRQILNRAYEMVLCSPGGYAPEKMQIRNERMVDRCDELVAVWNGDKFGGTWNCLKYNASKKFVHYINPKNLC